MIELETAKLAQRMDGFGGSIAFWGTHPDDRALSASILELDVSILRVQGEVAPNGDDSHNREILQRAVSMNPKLKTQP